MNIDVFAIPLFYISKARDEGIEKMYRDQGFTNVNYFKAVNGGKLDLLKLLTEKKITARTYNEVVVGKRKDWWGVSGMGAIGCALSHYTLWNLCVENNWDYITITEDDNKFIKPLNVEKIRATLQAQKSIYYGVLPQDVGFGTHFYIVSKDLCKEFIEYFFPIDLQVDSYMAWISKIFPDTAIGGDNLTIQARDAEQSSIQNFCIPCILPSSNGFYILIAAVIVILISGIIVMIFAFN